MKGFYHIWAWWPSWSCDQHRVKKFFISMYQKAYIQNLVKNGPVVSEKSKFLFSCLNDLEPRSRNDLDLECSFTLINSIRCLHLLNFRSQAAIISEKSTVFYRKAQITKFDLTVK